MIRPLMVLSGVFLMVSNSLFAEMRCGGGDGPHPVEGGEYKTEVVDTKGGINEFVFFKDRNLVVYRNSKNEIFDVIPGTLNYPKASSNNVMEADEKISSVVDPFERFVAVEGKWKVYDTSNDSWVKGPADLPINHLFWKGDTVYGLRAVGNTLGRRRLEFAQMSTRTGAVKSTCAIKEKPIGPLYLVHGQSYPDAHFISASRDKAGKITIYSYRFDVRNCNTVEGGTPIAEVASVIHSVHYFARYQAYGIHLKHPTHNFLWLTSDRSCRYFNLGAKAPVVPNYDLPVVMTVNPGKGLNIVTLNATTKPDEAKQVTLVPDLPITDLKERNIVMPRLGQLLLTPTLGTGRSRWMFRINIPNLEREEDLPN